jgi:hypothetical protein
MELAGEGERVESQLATPARQRRSADMRDLGRSSASGDGHSELGVLSFGMVWWLRGMACGQRSACRP